MPWRFSVAGRISAHTLLMPATENLHKRRNRIGTDDVPLGAEGIGWSLQFPLPSPQTLRDFYDMIVGRVYRVGGGIACNLLYCLTRAVGALVRAIMCRAT